MNGIVLHLILYAKHVKSNYLPFGSGFCFGILLLTWIILKLISNAILEV